MSTPEISAAQKAQTAKTRKFAILALLVAGVAVAAIAASGIGENLVYYWGPKDVKANGQKAIGATIRLGGQVAVGSVKRGDGVSNLEFDVTDGTETVHVMATGVPPQMFRDRIGVIVEGTMTQAGYFEGNRLMVSHDNKYKAPTDKDVDIKTLMRTAEGVETKPSEAQIEAMKAAGQKPAQAQ